MYHLKYNHPRRGHCGGVRYIYIGFAADEVVEQWNYIFDINK